jgi:hypothetical protein
MKRLLWSLYFLVVTMPCYSTIVWGPYGMTSVEPTSNGYTITNLNGGGTTVIERNATGYSIISPRGTTVIDMQGEDRLPPVLPIYDAPEPYRGDNSMCCSNPPCLSNC